MINLKPKKAQMEAFGLIIIVLLLALGIFFMTYTSMKKQRESQELSSQNIEMAQLMVDAIKNIKIECQTTQGVRNIPFDDFVQDIASEDNRIGCIVSNSYMSSNVYLEMALTNIFNATLINKSLPFYFVLKKRDYDYIYIINPDPDYERCSKFDQTISGDTGIQPIPLRGGGGVADIKLFLCDRNAVKERN